jgi:hypothetical protein
MQINGIMGAMFKEVQGTVKETSGTSSSGQSGFAFLNSLGDVARANMVVRGGELGAAGLHEQKLVKDWYQGLPTEEETTISELFGKIAEIDKLLKEKQS